jgi:hypothetical protein
MAAEAPAPGRYLAAGGWGHMVLKASGEAEMATVGANGHTCELSGKLEGWTIRARDCVVELKRLPNGLRATSADDDACREFCGARAGLEGDYLIPPKGCDDAERAAARRDFKRLYDAKLYTDALAKLEPVRMRCKDQIGWLENDWLINDIALAQFRAGDAKACLTTLRPLAQDAAKSDDDLADQYPPSDFTRVAPVIKAARTNLKLCGGG